MTLRAAAVTLALALLAAPAAAAQPPTLAGIEDQVMCTVCGVPLSMAREAPAAKRERALIQQLINEGRSEAEIKAELVATYGDGVLIEPRGKGFDLTAWLVPIILTLAGAAALAGLLISWRRRGETAPSAASTAGTLSEADARLVDEALRDSD